jgi:hypothetical protein
LPRSAPSALATEEADRFVLTEAGYAELALANVA